MRKALKYQFTTQHSDARWSKSIEVIEAWLASKGENARNSDGIRTITYPTGRVGHLENSRLQSTAGELFRWTLSESDGERNFVTTVSLARSTESLVFACDFDVGLIETIVSPSFFDAYCPNVVKNIVGLGGWQVAGTPVTGASIRFDGNEGGRALASFIRDGSRRLPVVAISEYDGFALHSDLPRTLARDLTGAALVACIDEEASWALTEELGKEMSCYLGAVRLYWPPPLEPGRSPLWTGMRLIDMGANRRDASNALRGELRNRILPVTALTVASASLFSVIEKTSHRERLDAQLSEARSSGNVDEIFEKFAAENARLLAQLDDQEVLITELRNRLENAEIQRQWQTSLRSASPNEQSATTDPEPESVDEAVALARKMFAEQLIFGDDVSDGVASVAAHAGPPQKLLRFISTLAKLSTTLAAGPLGLPPVEWLSDRGFPSSGESETVRNSTSEMKRRTWHDGASRIPFEYHMKVNEGTSPALCVRIYFIIDQQAKKVRIGWIGKHP